jgi:type IV secretory pathway TrbD component
MGWDPSPRDAWRHFRAGLTPEALLSGAAGSIALSALGFAAIRVLDAPLWIYAMLAVGLTLACSALVVERACREPRRMAREALALRVRFDEMERRVIACVSAAKLLSGHEAQQRWAEWAGEIEGRLHNAIEGGDFTMTVRDALMNPNARPPEIPEEVFDDLHGEQSHGALLARLIALQGGFLDARRRLTASDEP